MKDLSPNYRSEDGRVLIELGLRSLQQLFNTLDPSPFYEKDIDADAEAYIVGAASEIHHRKPIALVVYLPPGEIQPGDTASATDAIQHYFGYQAHAAQRELRLALRLGRISLGIGLGFLALCMGVRSLLPILGMGPVASEFLRESLLITGWVALWKPFQIFLYDWWPILHKIRVMRRLSRIEVELRPDTTTRIRRRPDRDVV